MTRSSKDLEAIGRVIAETDATEEAAKSLRTLVELCNERMDVYNEHLKGSGFDKKDAAKIYIMCQKMLAAVGDYETDYRRQSLASDKSLLQAAGDLQDALKSLSDKAEKLAGSKIEKNLIEKKDFKNPMNIGTRISLLYEDPYYKNASGIGLDNIHLDLIKRKVLLSEPLSKFDAKFIAKLEKDVIKHCEEVKSGKAFYREAKELLKIYEGTISSEFHAKDLQALGNSKEQCQFIVEKIGKIAQVAHEKGDVKLEDKLKHLKQAFEIQQDKALDRIGRIIEKPLQHYDAKLEAYFKTLKSDMKHPGALLDKIEVALQQIEKELNRFGDAIKGNTDAFSKDQSRRITANQLLLEAAKGKLTEARERKAERQEEREQKKENAEFIGLGRPPKRF